MNFKVHIIGFHLGQKKHKIFGRKTYNGEISSRIAWPFSVDYTDK